MAGGTTASDLSSNHSNALEMCTAGARPEGRFGDRREGGRDDRPRDDDRRRPSLRKRSASPPPHRAAPAAPYGVRLPNHAFGTAVVDYRETERRHAK